MYLITSGPIERKARNLTNARKTAKLLLNQYPRESRIYKIGDKSNVFVESIDVDWKYVNKYHKNKYITKKR